MDFIDERIVVVLLGVDQRTPALGEACQDTGLGRVPPCFLDHITNREVQPNLTILFPPYCVADFLRTRLRTCLDRADRAALGDLVDRF